MQAIGIKSVPIKRPEVAADAEAADAERRVTDLQKQAQKADPAKYE